MRRLLCLLAISFFIIPRIYAADEVTPDNFDAVQEEKANPTTYTKVQFDMSESIKFVAGAVQESITKRFDVIGKIIPIATGDNTFRYTDLSPMNPFLNKVSPFAISNYFSDEHAMVPWTTQNRESAKYCLQLIIDWPDGSKKRYYFTTDDTTEFSNDISYLKEFNANAQTMGALWALYQLDANANGTIVLDKEEKIVHSIGDQDCTDVTYDASALQQATTGVEDNASLLGDVITATYPFPANLVSGFLEIFIKARADLFQKSRISNIYWNTLHQIENTTKNIPR